MGEGLIVASDGTRTAAGGAVANPSNNPVPSDRNPFPLSAKPSAKPAPIRPQVAVIQENIEKTLKGKSEVVKNALIGLLARGHLLFEDVPGTGKTTLAQLLSRSIDVGFSRIQFTSDLLPSDILGVGVFDQARGEFEFKPGPLFAHIVLADELNRTTPKTQSALLEAMNSAQVTIDKTTHDLPQPFLVIATQNPVEFHGTFPLPKSQMDRFMMRLHLGYPAADEEMTVLREQRVAGDLSGVKAVVGADEVLDMQRAVDDVLVDESLLRYMVAIAGATRDHPEVRLGVSTRGTLALRRAAQAKAWYEGRDYCVPDDAKSLVAPVLAHRIQLSRERDTWGAAPGRLHEDEERLLARIVESIPVPV